MSRTNDATNNEAFGFRERSPEELEAMRKRREVEMATMSEEERKQFEERRKVFEEMRNLSPEERRKKFGEMASKPEFQQRMQERMMSGIKNMTPEQRVDRMKRFQQRGGGARK